MKGDPLPDEHHVARYCKPSTVDPLDRLPTVAAFQLRESDDHLSVNWLEFFGLDDHNAAMAQLRAAFDTKGYTLRPNGRFAVLNVGDAKTAINAADLHVTLDIKHWPIDEPPDPSHSGIFGYEAAELAVAVELKALVTQDKVHPGV